MDKSDLRASILENIEDALNEAIDKHASVTRISGWTARKSELQHVLRNAIEAESFLVGESQIKATPKSSSEVNGKALIFEAKCDRLDEIDGELYVIDYQNVRGRPEAVKRHARRVDCRYPAFSVYSSLDKAHWCQPVVGGYYYALNDGKPVIPINIKISGAKTQEIDEEGLRYLADTLKSAAQSGHYQSIRTVKQESCKLTCAFDCPSARRGPYLARLNEETA